MFFIRNTFERLRLAQPNMPTSARNQLKAIYRNQDYFATTVAVVACCSGGLGVGVDVDVRRCSWSSPSPASSSMHACMCVCISHRNANVPFGCLALCLASQHTTTYECILTRAGGRTVPSCIRRMVLISLRTTWAVLLLLRPSEASI